MKPCGHLDDFARRCVALAPEGRLKCIIHEKYVSHTPQRAEPWPAGQPFPVYWEDAEPRRAFDTPWER